MEPTDTIEYKHYTHPNGYVDDYGKYKPIPADISPSICDVYFLIVYNDK